MELKYVCILRPYFDFTAKEIFLKEFCCFFCKCNILQPEPCGIWYANLWVAQKCVFRAVLCCVVSNGQIHSSARGHYCEGRLLTAVTT